jgi:ubiquinol-cytochrome c reductase cytochrome b subunit
VKLWEAFRERAALSGNPRQLSAGASFAYVFGVVLMFLLVVEGVTGIALATVYSPSTTDAWASVAYIQDQMPGGWLVRGLHHHGGSAIVIVAGLHLVQTAVAGAYKKPRELVWWLGLALLALVLGWAITGYWLRWDQSGFYAAQVELGIAAGAPILGGLIKGMAIGGNDYGNLTLTRAYAVHILVLPALVVIVTYFHVKIARRLGPTPLRKAMPPTPYWPVQSVRNALAIAVTFALLFVYVISQHGVDLASPADPTSPFDARPLWPFRWLFELRTLAGSAEQLVAMAAPAVFGGFLVSLPFIDRRSERSPGQRKLVLGVFAMLFSVMFSLTLASYASDDNDANLDGRRRKEAALSARARQLAITNGVPITGPLDVFKTAPMWKARSMFAQRCAGCHGADSPDRKGPVIAAGHGNRAWLTQFLKTPSGDAFYGHTKLSASEAAMKPVELPASDLMDLVELLYAQTGATDTEPAKVERGAKVFDAACTDCHTLGEGEASVSGPNLFGLGSRDYYTSFIGNPKSPIHMGKDKSQMPAFSREMSLVDRDLVAEYLVWLRTATEADVGALGPL